VCGTLGMLFGDTQRQRRRSTPQGRMHAHNYGAPSQLAFSLIPFIKEGCHVTACRVSDRSPLRRAHISMEHSSRWSTHLDGARISMEHASRWSAHLDGAHIAMEHASRWSTHLDGARISMEHASRWSTHLHTPQVSRRQPRRRSHGRSKDQALQAVDRTEACKAVTRPAVTAHIALYTTAGGQQLQPHLTLTEFKGEGGAGSVNPAHNSLKSSSRWKRRHERTEKRHEHLFAYNFHRKAFTHPR